MDAKFLMELPMRCGDMQSVLQLTIGLNLAYFSFREIRSPAVMKYAKEYELAEKILVEARQLAVSVVKPANLLPFDEATNFYLKREKYEWDLEAPAYNLQGYKHPYVDNIADWDNVIRGLALIVATCGFAGLFYVSAYPDTQVSVPLFGVVTAASLIPTFVAIAYNWALSNLIHRTISQLAEIRKSIISIRTDFSDKCLRPYSVFIRSQVKQLETKSGP